MVSTKESICLGKLRYWKTSHKSGQQKAKEEKREKETRGIEHKEHYGRRSGATRIKFQQEGIHCHDARLMQSLRGYNMTLEVISSFMGQTPNMTTSSRRLEELIWFRSINSCNAETLINEKKSWLSHISVVSLLCLSIASNKIKTKTDVRHLSDVARFYTNFTSIWRVFRCIKVQVLNHATCKAPRHWPGRS